MIVICEALTISGFMIQYIYFESKIAEKFIKQTDRQKNLSMPEV